MRWFRDLIRFFMGASGDEDRAQRERRRWRHKRLDEVRDERMRRFLAASQNLQEALEAMAHSKDASNGD